MLGLHLDSRTRVKFDILLQFCTRFLHLDCLNDKVFA